QRRWRRPKSKSGRRRSWIVAWWPPALEPQSQVDEQFRGALSAVAAENRIESASALERGGEVVGQPNSHAATRGRDGLIDQSRTDRCSALNEPGLGAIGEDVGLERAHDGFGKAEVVVEFE